MATILDITEDEELWMSLIGLGQRAREARAIHGYSQGDVGARIKGLSDTFLGQQLAVSRFERGSLPLDEQALRVVRSLPDVRCRAGQRGRLAAQA